MLKLARMAKGITCQPFVGAFPLFVYSDGPEMPSALILLMWEPGS